MIEEEIGKQELKEETPADKSSGKKKPSPKKPTSSGKKKRSPKKNMDKVKKKKMAPVKKVHDEDILIEELPAVMDSRALDYNPSYVSSPFR